MTSDENKKRIHKMLAPHENEHPDITKKFDVFQELAKTAGVDCRARGVHQIWLTHNGRFVGEFDCQPGFEHTPSFYVTGALGEIRKLNDAVELRRYKSYHALLAHIACIKSKMITNPLHPKDGGQSSCLPAIKLLDHAADCVDAMRGFIEPRAALGL